MGGPIAKYIVYVYRDEYESGSTKVEDLPGFIESDWEDLEYPD